MANVVVTGMQWGDEGKGKVVDLLCPAFDAVVRFQGGNNAGHTVKFADGTGERHFALHLIPSGILRPDMHCVLGNGMVIAPEALFAELERLAEAGVRPDGRLWVSDRAQVLLPGHAESDREREAARGERKIGTTAKGIGPAYEAKVARRGIRVADLEAPDLADKLAAGRALVGRPLATEELDRLVAACRAWGERLQPFTANTAYRLDDWIREGKSVLFEGAQGVLLDVDHGTYPYVTSSNATAGGAATGSGVPPSKIDGSIGVLKAYTTRVGEGPFPTELEDEAGEFLRKRGNEFGTTTGRPRRCGWLDLVVARYACLVNGVDSIALTKLDVLDTFETIDVCVGYEIDGYEVTEVPARLDRLASAQPVYRTLPGWRQDTVGCLGYEDLPENARRYVEFVEEALGTEIGILSTGPKREETIVRPGGRLAELAPRL